MKIYLKYLRGSFIGTAYAALIIVLSRLLVRNLSGIFGWAGSLASLDKETLTQGTQILAQLKPAVIISPWLPFLLSGAVLGALIAWAAERRPVRLFVIVLVPCLLLLPLTLLALWFTIINDIGFGSLIRSVLPTMFYLL
ncbi:MAG: hypothetical protein IK133_04780 [Clostridia bacterium]|nr:hypothetical protein [Clostridia bacterium]